MGGSKGHDVKHYVTNNISDKRVVTKAIRKNNDTKINNLVWQKITYI